MRTPLTFAAYLLLAGPAAAQAPDLQTLLQPGEMTVSGQIIQYIALITILSIAPGLLIMVTSFTRFVIAFSFLRSGLGLQSTPANLVLVSLSLFLTFFVMAPVFERAYTEGIQPLVAEQIGPEEAFNRAAVPFREFMLRHVREKDLGLFSDISGELTDVPAELDQERDDNNQDCFVGAYFPDDL